MQCSNTNLIVSLSKLYVVCFDVETCQLADILDHIYKKGYGVYNIQIYSFETSIFLIYLAAQTFASFQQNPCSASNWCPSCSLCGVDTSNNLYCYPLCQAPAYTCYVSNFSSTATCGWDVIPLFSPVYEEANIILSMYFRREVLIMHCGLHLHLSAELHRCMYKRVAYSMHHVLNYENDSELNIFASERL